MSGPRLLLFTVLLLFTALVPDFVHGAACVIECSPDEGLYGDLNLPDCPTNAECRKTGCGAMCFPVEHGVDGREADKRGVCVIQCSPGFGLYEDLGLADCPPEHECRSTGCGTLCYSVHRDSTTAAPTGI